MSQPLMSVVRTANSPDQAKMFVALLQAEGIPAHVDGDGLVDEFVTSRRMMNLTGVKVLVPTSSLEPRPARAGRDRRGRTRTPGARGRGSGVAAAVGAAARHFFGAGLFMPCWIACSPASKMLIQSPPFLPPAARFLASSSRRC